MSDPEKERAVQANIERLLGDLTERAYAGQIQGIAVATITEEGFSCRFAHFDKQRGPLLAATLLLQHDIVASFELRDAPPIDDAT
jgi:hypothetical protein